MSSRGNISPREQEVLQLIAYEHTSKEIASELYISEHTALTHRKNLIIKLGVRNTAGLVRKGFEMGILKIKFTCFFLFSLCVSLISQQSLINNNTQDITQWIINSKTTDEETNTLRISTNALGFGNSVGVKVQNLSKGLSSESLSGLFETNASIFDLQSGSVLPTTQVAVGLRASANGGSIGNFAAIFGDGDVLVENSLLLPNPLAVDRPVWMDSAGRLYPAPQVTLTKYTNIPFAAFSAEEFSEEVIDTSGNTLTVRGVENAIFTEEIYAPVILPHRERIESIVGAVHHDGSGVVILYRQPFPNFNNASPDILMQATYSLAGPGIGSFGSSTCESSIAADCITDNQNFVYYLKYVGGGKLQGVSIGHTGN